MSFQEADATEKKRTLWIVLVMGFFCALVIWWFRRWLVQIDTLLAGGQTTIAKQQIALVHGIAALLLSVCLLSLAALAIQHGLAVLRSGRFPSASARLFARMTVHTGPAAMFRGRINLVIAAFLLIGALITFPYGFIAGRFG